jgi:AcrR family transcriptional regulator
MSLRDDEHQQHNMASWRSLLATGSGRATAASGPAGAGGAGARASGYCSKEALIDAALRSASEAWFAELDAEIQRRDGDPLSQLLAPFDLLVADLPDPAYHGCIFVNSAATFCSSDHPAHRALAAHHQRMLQLFERLAAGAGAARPAELARQLLLLYYGVKTQGLVDHSGAAATDARAAAVALLRL